MILPQLDLLDYLARLAQLVGYFLGVFFLLAAIALVIWLWYGAFEYFVRLYRGTDKPWQYRVDVSTLGRVVITRYFDGRAAAARFIRRWRRVPQAAVAVHGERWT